jgi:hypothetical protein
MEKMLINERFKSPNKEFEKVYILFNKKDYFDENSQVKKKQEEFVRFLKKGDPMATKVFKQHKEDMKSSLSFIEEMVRDYNKKNHFEAFQLFASAVNALEMVTKPNLKQKPANLIKSKIHNNSQKYSLAIYSAIRKQKFNNYKDVHKDVDELTSKNESVNEAYIVLHSPKKGVKPVATAAYRDKKDAQKWAKELGGITMIVQKKMKGIDESQQVNLKSVDVLRRAVQKINKKYKVQVSKIGPTKGEVEIELGDGNHPDRDYRAIDNLVKKIGIKRYSVFNEGKSSPYGSGYKKAPLLPTTTDHAEVSEASIKGKNNKTGESFGMVIGSDKKNREGDFEVTIRKTYSSRITSYKFIFDDSSNLIEIADYGYSMDGKFPDMKGSASVKSVKPNPRETITQIAKVTSPAFAKKIVQHVKKVNESVKEATFRPNSGTMSGGTHGLDNRKYKLKRDVKGVRIGDYTNIILPKGTIIYNIPGGVFAHHDVLAAYQSGQNKYFNKPTFKGISIRREKSTILSIEKNSKILESVNEGKYNYKADALTAYFKGKIDAKELDKIARDDFKSGIATKKELSNFLSNKFTQDVMSDTYGIPAGTLIKRVRGLMKFAEGKDGGVPQGYNPMVEDKNQIKGLVKKVKHEKLFYDVLDTMEKKYGKRKYRIWLEKSLKDFGVNPKHYDYRTNAGAEEKLFQLGK